MPQNLPNNWPSRWLVALSLTLLLVVAVSTLGYRLIEHQSLLDGLYITVITISTVGSREIPNMSPMGQWWTIGVVVFGVGTAAATFSAMVAALTEGTLRRMLGRRQLQRAIEQLSGHTIVCGYGRMGGMVAAGLRDAGRDVMAVELSAEPADRADAAGVPCLRGDAQDEAVLAAAGIDRAGHLVACLPSDADNVFVTLTARQLNRSLRIIARATEPSTQNKLLHAGADRVICPQIIGANRIADVILRPAVVDFVEVANQGVDLELDQLVVSPGSDLVGKNLRSLALPTRLGAMVVAVRKADGQAVYSPGAEMELTEGDTLILVGRSGVAEAVQKVHPEVSPGPAPAASEG